MTAPLTGPSKSSAAHPRPIDRRGFLGIAWGLVLAALTGEGTAAMWEFLRPPRRAGGFGGMVRAGRVEEFAPGSVSHVAAGQFFISRVDEGLLAMWHRCTHLGCTIPWIEAEGRFNCPCHGSIFNTRGEVLAGPAPRPMDLFAIQILEGEVWVDTGQAITRSAFARSQATQT